MEKMSELVLQVADVQAEACDVLLVELRDPKGALLPAFEPGAHLEISLPNGMVRHFSISNDCRERDRYVVGVGRAPNGRGGSKFVHQTLRCGMVLKTSTPRNNFPLDPNAESYLFVAGGIGITPIMAMIRWCIANQRIWRLVYAVRSAQRAAFYETLSVYGDLVHFHFDSQCRGVGLDVRQILMDVKAGEHLYCCGPNGLMEAIRAHGEHLPHDRLHFEYFAAPTRSDDVMRPTGAFDIELRKSGRSFHVPPEKSVLDVLEANGVSVPFSCREGLCRTCETGVCEGEVEHLDYALTQEERDAGKSMIVCVSRARSARLVLDL
jgi:vanillate O-demethylase ferredoxin subunit